MSKGVTVTGIWVHVLAWQARKSRIQAQRQGWRRRILRTGGRAGRQSSAQQQSVPCSKAVGNLQKQWSYSAVHTSCVDACLTCSSSYPDSTNFLVDCFRPASAMACAAECALHYWTHPASAAAHLTPAPPAVQLHTLHRRTILPAPSSAARSPAAPAPTEQHRQAIRWYQLTVTGAAERKRHSYAAASHAASNCASRTWSLGCSARASRSASSPSSQPTAAGWGGAPPGLGNLTARGHVGCCWVPALSPRQCSEKAC